MYHASKCAFKCGLLQRRLLGAMVFFSPPRTDCFVKKSKAPAKCRKMPRAGNAERLWFGSNSWEDPFQLVKT
jgi:hypothetical protein